MKEQLLFSVTIEQLLKQRIGTGLNTEIVLIRSIKEYIHLFSFPLRVDAAIFLFCTKGNIDVNINLTNVKITPNNYGISVPENVIGLNSVSDDFEGFVLLLSIDYLRKISIDLTDLLPYYMHVRNNPLFKARPENIEIIISYFNLFSFLLEAENSVRKSNIISGFAISFINKIAEDVDLYELDVGEVKTKSKEYYYMRFMELLQQNFREQHNISFYSEKLSLTPKYLSSLMKDISDLSASEWINNYIVVEAKTLLKFSDMTIWEVADYLHFSNQSFFSKYFKHHTGLTPKQYRKD
ncbi:MULTISPECIES: helix-turn-helix domain-containing protein [Marinilabiliales]|jgi:AraC-like DNA-binding protein|uniref:Transcriptional regulator, AraC family n=1 Tax=Geofilum rubicundum JCM 15548 TaxID=1236989 RepID=A0A0E9LS66_9BACT|nr:AraC family transcriptional regulator [Geofilum rubicundum]GAO27705.1 transcriptional regulator, AraC family [Geofilum rubicundum JCM 15548]